MLEQVAIQIGNLTVEEYHDVLDDQNKVATGKTKESIEYEIRIKDKYTVSVVILADKGLFHIEVGKKANTKLPVKKEGDVFVLVDELQDWKDAIVPDFNDYLLARTIAENPREGIPITQIVWDQIKEKISILLLDVVAKEKVAQIRGDILRLYPRVS